MDSLSAVNTSATLAGIVANSAVTPSYNLLASELGLSSPAVPGNASAFVAISGVGQLLSAASAFQNTLQALQPGTPTSGGGQNFGTDFASLAAETQSLVNAFNTLQNSIANVNGGALGSEGNTTASNLAQTLNTQAQAGYGNGNSTLTGLSQLGITFQPALLPGASSKLSINLSALQSAFNTDNTGAFSLLGKAANAFSEVAGSFISQSSGQYSSLALLAQSPFGTSLFSGGLTPEAQANNVLFGLLSGATLAGGISPQQALAALNEYTLVSSLFG